MTCNLVAKTSEYMLLACGVLSIFIGVNLGKLY